jgi:hypothetical protein
MTSFALTLALLVAAGPEGTPEQELAPVVQPVREAHRVALLAEAGWNSLSGVGVNLTWNVVPHLAIDLGAGLSGVGTKLGARARLNFMASKFTPFVGAGVIRGGGTGDTAVELTSEGNVITFTLKPSLYAQFVAGFEIMSSGGFTFLATAGYAMLTGGDNVEMVGGVPTDLQSKALDVAYGSGPSASVALGFAF